MFHPAESKDVYNSPEFKAFCERFGIPWGLYTTDIIIRLPLNDVMTVSHDYHATDEKCGFPVGRCGERSKESLPYAFDAMHIDVRALDKGESKWLTKSKSQ